MSCPDWRSCRRDERGPRSGCGRDDVRANIARLAGDEAAAFSGGLALIALLDACGVARVDGSYWLAIVGVVAAAAVVVALRWMVPPGSR